MTRTGVLVSLMIIIGLVAAPAALAKGGTPNSKPGGGTSAASLTGPVMVTDTNGNGAPNYMDDITFNVSTTASQPQVGLRCWQGTTWVLDAYVAYFDSWLSAKYFTLGSSYWDPALSASCTARLFYYNKRGVEQVQATLTFSVAP